MRLFKPVNSPKQRLKHPPAHPHKVDKDSALKAQVNHKRAAPDKLDKTAALPVAVVSHPVVNPAGRAAVSAISLDVIKRVAL